MSHPTEKQPNSNGLELNHETLDQWESELDQFAMGIRQRLSLIALTAGTESPSTFLEPDPASEEQQSLDVLKSIRDLQK